MKLYQANRQWASRPADERFWSVAEMVESQKALASASEQATVRYHELSAVPSRDDILLVGKTGAGAKLCHWAFGQLAQRVGAPAEYLRKISPELAAENINFGLARRDPTDEAKLLLHRFGDGRVARCLTSDKYMRIWNYEIGERLLQLGSGWRTPPARPVGVGGERTRQATEADVLRNQKLGLSIHVGDLIAPAGVYASDRDMFVFLVDDDHRLENPIGGTPLARGFFVWNSEVGDKTFGLTTFLYDAICGNHIVWGAQNVKEIKLKHVGHARNRAFAGMRLQLREYAESSISDEQFKINRAQNFLLGGNKEDALSTLLSYTKKRKFLSVGEKELEAAYAIAEETPRYGNPRSPWAITQGLTELSQREQYASQRVRMDREAGQILEVAF